MNEKKIETKVVELPKPIVLGDLPEEKVWDATDTEAEKPAVVVE